MLGLDFESISVGFELEKLKRKNGGREFHSRLTFYLRRLRCSTYSDAASAAKATIARLANSGTGMLDCCMYMFPAVPTSPPVTATLNVCEAIPGLAMINE